MRLYQTLFSVTLAAALLASCSDNDTAVTSTTPVGTLKGSVILIDSLGNTLTDASGATVSLQGTSITATTDANGVWVMTNVPTRTYTIVYSKAAFTTMRDFGFQFVGGDTVYHDYSKMWMPIRRRIQLQSAGPSGTYIKFSGLLPEPPASTPKFALIGGVSADSAALATSRTFGAATSVDFETGSNGTSSPFGVSLVTIADLQAAGFHSGQKLYAAMHMIGIGPNWQNYTNYLDRTTGEYTFPSAGPVSEVIGFTMP